MYSPNGLGTDPAGRHRDGGIPATAASIPAAPNESVAVMGPSGSSKATLLTMIAGLTFASFAGSPGRVVGLSRGAVL